MSIMTDRAKSIALEITAGADHEHIEEHIDRELLNYTTVDLVVLCQEVQGEQNVFTDPEPSLNQDFDQILKVLAHNALYFLVMQEL